MLSGVMTMAMISVGLVAALPLFVCFMIYRIGLALKCAFEGIRDLENEPDEGERDHGAKTSSS